MDPDALHSQGRLLVDVDSGLGPLRRACIIGQGPSSDPMDSRLQELILICFNPARVDDIGRRLIVAAISPLHLCSSGHIATLSSSNTVSRGILVVPSIHTP